MISIQTYTMEQGLIYVLQEHNNKLITENEELKGKLNKIVSDIQKAIYLVNTKALITVDEDKDEWLLFGKMLTEMLISTIKKEQYNNTKIQ